MEVTAALKICPIFLLPRW